MVKVALAAALLSLAACRKSPETELRKQLAAQRTGTINLPAGVVELSTELRIPEGAHDLDIVGSGTILKLTDEFQGRAALVIEGGRNLRLRDFSIDGNRIVLERQIDAAPPGTAIRDYYVNNGVLLDRIDGAEISNLSLANIANLAIIASRSSHIKMHHLRLEDNGSLDLARHSNGTGGIAIEQGGSDFELRSSTFRRLRGDGLWTYSPLRAPRLESAVFASNRFDAIGRNAILIWNATKIRVEENTGDRIGYPAENVDPARQPVALGSLGDVDQSVYARNRFYDIDGKCIELDGFHDGAVKDNQCANHRPSPEYPFGHFGIVMNNTQEQPADIEISGNVIDGMKYGGLFLIGSRHRVFENRFEHLNQAGCREAGEKGGCVYIEHEPQMLESAIYLGRGGARAAVTRGNIIRGNTISGFKMKSRCIAAAPGVSVAANTISANQCADFSIAP